MIINGVEDGPEGSLVAFLMAVCESLMAHLDPTPICVVEVPVPGLSLPQSVVEVPVFAFIVKDVVGVNQHLNGVKRGVNSPQSDYHWSSSPPSNPVIFMHNEY